MTLKELFETAGEFLVSNIAVTMSLFLVLAKVTLIRIASDTEAQIRSLLRIPEELSYIALSFVLAGLTGDLKAFRKFFADSPHPVIATGMMILVSCLVCLWVHFCDSKLVAPCHERWRAANTLLNELDLKAENKKKTESVLRQSANYSRVWASNFAGMILSYLFFCFLPAASWLWYVADIIRNNS